MRILFVNVDHGFFKRLGNLRRNEKLGSVLFDVLVCWPRVVGELETNIHPALLVIHAEDANTIRLGNPLIATFLFEQLGNGVGHADHSQITFFFFV